MHAAGSLNLAVLAQLEVIGRTAFVVGALLGAIIVFVVFRLLRKMSE